MRFRLACVLGISLILTAVATYGGTNQWTRVGNDGGTIQSLAVDPLTPATIFAGLYLDGGVWKSTDSAAHWQQSSVGIGPYSIASIGVSPVHSGIVLAVGSLGPLYRSTDEGSTWTAVLQVNSYRATAFAYVPSSSTVYFGAGAALYRSTDDGATWTSSTKFSNDAIQAIVATASTLYVGYMNNGIYASGDGGVTWSGVNGSLPSSSGSYDLQFLVGDPQNASVLYTTVSDGKLYKTTDGATTWSAVSSTSYPFLYVQPVTSYLFAVGSAAPAAGLHVLESTDGGATFTAVSGHITGGAGIVAFNPAASSTLYANLDEGVYKSTDGGSTWSSANTGLRGHHALSLSFSPSVTGEYWAGLYTALTRTLDGGSTFAFFYPTSLAPAGDVIAVHPTNGSLVVADSFQACFPCASSGVVRTTDGGTTWTAAANPAYPTGTEALFLSSIVFDPSNPDTAYMGSSSGFSSNHIYKTTDAGNSFAVSSTGMTGFGHVPVDMALTHPTSSTTTVFTADLSAGVYRSTDAGASWQQVTTGLPSPAGCSAAAVDPTTSSVVYASMTATTGSGLYKSSDGGNSWSMVGSGLPGNSAPSSLAIDPTATSVIYAGFSGYSGVYRSADSGATFSPFSAGLSNLYVSKIATDPSNHNHLVIATTGGGLWEMTFDSATTGPAVPTNLTATANATQVQLSWTASTGAVHYDVERTAAPHAYSPIGSPTSNAYPDGAVSAGVTYVYRVRAVDGSGNASSFSEPVAATTIAFTDDPIVAGVTIIKAVHLTELREAVNAMLAAAGEPALGGLTDPSLAAGTTIRAAHITELRTALNQARTAMGLPSLTFSTLAAGTTIHATDVQTLRDAVK